MLCPALFCLLSNAKSREYQGGSWKLEAGRGELERYQPILYSSNIQTNSSNPSKIGPKYELCRGKDCHLSISPLSRDMGAYHQFLKDLALTLQGLFAEVVSKYRHHTHN